MVTCLLLVAGLLAASPAWYELPTARQLHPVRYNAWGRFAQLHHERTSGLGASPIFRAPNSQAQVYYALWDATLAPPLLEDSTAEEWRDMALAGASVAGEALLWETLERSEQLWTVVRFARTFVAPNLELERSRDGWTAKANDPYLRTRMRLERAELAAGILRPPPRRPALRFGTGLDLPDVDELNESEQVVDVAAWLRLQRLGIDQLDLRARLETRSWEFSARQKVHPGIAGALSLASESDGALVPRSWATGLNFNPRRLGH